MKRVQKKHVRTKWSIVLVILMLIAYFAPNYQVFAEVKGVENSDQMPVKESLSAEVQVETELIPDGSDTPINELTVKPVLATSSTTVQETQANSMGSNLESTSENVDESVEYPIDDHESEVINSTDLATKGGMESDQELDAEVSYESTSSIAITEPTQNTFSEEDFTTGDIIQPSETTYPSLAVDELEKIEQRLITDGDHLLESQMSEKPLKRFTGRKVDGEDRQLAPESITVDTTQPGSEFAKKTVIGTGFLPQYFPFVWYEADAEGFPLYMDSVKNAEVTFSEAGTQVIDLGTITYTEAGEYLYRIREGLVAVPGSGWIFDNEKRTITVVVTDNGQGQLEAEVTGVHFTNSYEAREVEVDTKAEGTEFAKKTVSGTGFAAKDFSFSMIEVDAEGTAIAGTAAITADLNFTEAGTQSIDFGTITYTEAGDHFYKIIEDVPEADGAGWTYDRVEGVVKVVVTDNGRGQLEAEVTGVELTNSYKAREVEVDTKAAGTEFATKSVIGTGFLPQYFPFSLYEINAEGFAIDNGIYKNADVTFSEAGTQVIDLGTITYTEAGEYFYRIAEGLAAIPGSGWIFDNEEKIIAVVVTDNGQGQLEAEVTGVHFTNSYKAREVEVDTKAEGTEFAKKTVSGTGFAAKDFSFSMIEVDAEGTAIAGTAARTADLNFTEAGTQSIDFGTITYTEAGDHFYKIIEDVPEADSAGWTYDRAEKIVKVVVTDNGQGQLEAEVTGVHFTNSYKAREVEVDTKAAGTEFAKKTVAGTDFVAKDFSFNMIEVDAESTAIIAGTEARTAGLNFTEAGTQVIDFGTVTYTEAGEHFYKITEDVPEADGVGWTYDRAEGIVKVVVIDNGRGQLEAEVTGVEFTNSYKAPFVEQPGVVLTKIVEEDSYMNVGDILTFVFTIENTGNVTLNNLYLNDEMLGIESELITEELNSGEKLTIKRTYKVTKEDVAARKVINTANIIGKTPNNTDSTDTDTCEIGWILQPDPTQPEPTIPNPTQPEPTQPKPTQPEAKTDKPLHAVPRTGEAKTVAGSGILLIIIAVALIRLRKRKAN